MERTRGILRHASPCQAKGLEISDMFHWVPIIFLVFKLAVFGTGMFFAIKWHYDQDKKKKMAPDPTQEGSR